MPDRVPHSALPFHSSFARRHGPALGGGGLLGVLLTLLSQGLLDGLREVAPAEPVSVAPSAPTEPAPAIDKEACDRDPVVQAYCAGLDSLTGWQAWCQAQAWAVPSATVLDPCVNTKYAHDSCTEAAIAAGLDVSAGCRAYMATLNDNNEAFVAACVPYCSTASIAPGPGKDPCAEWVGSHLSAVSSECVAAYTKHEADKKAPPTTGIGPQP